jgi:hypothetical protein
MVGVNSGSNMYEVRRPIFSTTNEVDGQSRTGSSIRVVTRRASSSLSKGLKGLFVSEKYSFKPSRRISSCFA